ncbi:hypothetical protein Atc_1207 [Acidithiobacillus caldus SM-1]|uniref:Uncharacterized protein n=1 Tax=Acidithiobacillus caldus (strain SM-1) TaxID=990288 RepID=F9ZMU7_ACICS|nr:hypothetical protein Atc_1207 [Acidithiobacillus caldus SM-1]
MLHNGSHPVHHKSGIDIRFLCTPAMNPGSRQ